MYTNDFSPYIVPLLNDTLDLVHVANFRGGDITPSETQVIIQLGSDSLYYVLSMGIHYQRLRRMPNAFNRNLGEQAREILDKMIVESIRRHSEYRATHTIH